MKKRELSDTFRAIEIKDRYTHYWPIPYDKMVRENIRITVQFKDCADFLELKVTPERPRLHQSIVTRKGDSDAHFIIDQTLDDFVKDGKIGEVTIEKSERLNDKEILNKTLHMLDLYSAIVNRSTYNVRNRL